MGFIDLASGQLPTVDENEETQVPLLPAIGLSGEMRMEHLFINLKSQGNFQFLLKKMNFPFLIVVE